MRSRRCSCSTSVLLRIALSWLAASLAAGPLQSVSILSELYIREGLFFSASCAGLPAGECPHQNTVLRALFYASICISVVLLFVVGHFQDAFGGKISGAVGGLLVAFGMSLHALAIVAFPPLLFLALPIADAAGYLASLAMYSFIFHCGAHNVGLILGFVHSNFQISSLGSVLLQYMVEDLQVPLAHGVLIFAGAAFLSTLLAFFVNADAEEYREATSNATGKKPAQISFNPIKMLRDVWMALKKYPRHNMMLFFTSASCYTFYLNFASARYQWTILLVGEAAASSLNIWISIGTSCIALVMSPLSGFLFDRLGVFKYLFVYISLLALALVSLWWPLFWVQLVSSVMVEAFASSWLTLVAQWWTIFGPFELVAGMNGFFLAVCGITQLVINNVFTVIMNRVSTGTTVYVIPFAVIGGVALITTIALIVFLAKRSAEPSAPTLSVQAAPPQIEIGQAEASDNSESSKLL